jgi:hypothetical protein
VAAEEDPQHRFEDDARVDDVQERGQVALIERGVVATDDVRPAGASAGAYGAPRAGCSCSQARAAGAAPRAIAAQSDPWELCGTTPSVANVRTIDSSGLLA